ncbi:MAG: rhamnulokinase [Verrucomicrobia bacterium]|nr:rhamnulokinase [Verrucomicrobiota bacterium]
MNPKHYIACDLGAESGRVMLGRLEDGRLKLEELHRFPSAAVRVLGTMRWDVLRIFEELKTGLAAVAQHKLSISSLSVDSWGVDYVLINAVHPVLWPPFHYRDARTEETYEKVRAKIGAELIFAETGIQFMSINTIYHLASDLEYSRPLLELADCFLTIGDYFNYLFSGVPRVDESNASTTQLYNPQSHAWSTVLIDRCGFPEKIFPKLVAPGTILGPLLGEIAAETGLGELQVVATCSHDTGAAVAAVPADDKEDWAYLSSGTWSLLGVELPGPLINERVRELNFTNEAGYGGTTRFLKNIVGLWLLQECRREWLKQGRQLDYATLIGEAERAEPFRSLIDPRAVQFIRPGNMPERIVLYCLETGQAAPETAGQHVRCILESLALLYRVTLEEIERLTGRTIRRLHIVGGGSRNTLLDEFAANATSRQVIAGPVEATATGNVLIQAVALGHVKSLPALRRVVRDSFGLQTFEPRVAEDWQAPYERFLGLKPVL